MSTNIEWGSATNMHFEFVAPKQFDDDPHGYTNNEPALVIGPLVIEGSADELEAMLHRALHIVLAAKVKVPRDPCDA